MSNGVVNKIVIHDAQDLYSEPMNPKLIYADPPFNIGVKYDKYIDKVKNYEDFAEKWVSNVSLFLTAGFFVICCPPSYSYLYSDLLISYGLKYYDKIIWHRTFGQQSNDPSWLSRTYTELLIFNRGSVLADWDRIRTPSERMMSRDARANLEGKIPGQVWVLPDNPQSSIWKISQVTGNSNERVHWHPAQQPIELLRRIITGLTNYDDFILDPFSGSGTTSLVAKLLRRNSLAWDISEHYVLQGNKRIKEYMPT